MQTAERFIGKVHLMNLNEEKYNRFALVREMMETVDVVRNFNSNSTKDVACTLEAIGSLLLTGEGSSRIFPAKNTIRKARKKGVQLNIFTEGSRQAAQYDLADSAVFCASNSGRTKELIVLIKKLLEEGNDNLYALTASSGTMLEDLCRQTFVLRCGNEDAVAATKSVVEQALFYESILWNVNGNYSIPDLALLASAIETALTQPLNESIIEYVSKANTVYFAGYNDGVAEELTLKTNEIIRRKSDYLEGTYAVHGIEEVMEPDDVVFVIDPVEEEISKFQEVLEKGVGLKIVAVSNRETPFETILIPDAGEMNPYVYLCVGWNLLVESGLALSVNLDKPERARKVGNEFTL